MGTIIVGGIIKRDNKYLLVQEAQEDCYGKWNIPAGHLDANETIFEGAKREIYEETGFHVELTGIAQIGNIVKPDKKWIGIVFSTEIIDGDIKYDPEEILNVKWFTYDEIMNMKDKLRSVDWIIHSIGNVENNNIGNINLVKVIK